MNIKETFVDMVMNEGFLYVYLEMKLGGNSLSIYFETVEVNDVISKYRVRREDTLANFFTCSRNLFLKEMEIVYLINKVSE
ncbi:hypothetical protein [Sulfuracidifex metallicus]|uniref:hypothetical protein n=1 Tax=Sulfuracidifex metallicus TaxID=47303 RepID=UPI0006CF32F9|nr:hypothetical protein [Sulfuracidifex metallicus]